MFFGLPPSKPAVNACPNSWTTVDKYLTTVWNGVPATKTPLRKERARCCSDTVSSFGIKSLRFQNSDDLEKAQNFVSAWDSGPLVLEFIVSPEAKALPKMGMGTSIQDL